MARKRLSIEAEKQTGEQLTDGHKPNVVAEKIGAPLSAGHSRQRPLKTNSHGRDADLHSEVRKLRDEATGLRFRLEASQGHTQSLLSERNRLARELRSLRKAVRIVRLAVEDVPAGLTAEENVSIPDEGVEQRADHQ